MKRSSSDLPAFAFPVVAWPPDPGTNDPRDDGIREFLAPDQVTTTYFPESELRLGWTFVDAEGRSWEAVSSRVTGRADPWWIRWPPGWVYNRKYRLQLEFEERPAITFDGVKTRLHAAVTANHEFYRGDARQRRSELRAAQSLRDLIKSDEDRAIERIKPTTIWWQWLLAEGRCSRRAFLVVSATLIFMIWLVIFALRFPAPALVIGLLPFAAWWLSAVVQRVHDLGRSVWWLAAWYAFSMLCAVVHDTAIATPLKEVVAATWQISTSGLLAFLAVAPGTRGPNRYGL